jgi:O-antigen ligase
MAALSVFALVASRSRTSIAAFAFLLATSIALVLARDAGLDFSRAWRRTSLALVLAVGLLPFLLAPLAPAFGDRDPLNGRLRIWSGALAILRERPWTGYGYAVVWGRAKATLLPHIPITAHPSSTDAHNSIVDVATTLGIPAAAVACVYLFGALSDAGRLFARESNAFSFFALAFVVGSVAMGFGESHLLHVHWFFWILFVGVTATVKRTLERPPADSVLDRAPVS